MDPQIMGFPKNKDPNKVSLISETAIYRNCRRFVSGVLTGCCAGFDEIFVFVV